MAKKRKKSGGGWKIQIFMIMSLIMGVMFSAVAVVMVVGMIPSIVAGIVDSTKGKVKTLTVGSINFAGCVPFMLEVFKQGNNMSTAVSYIVQPRTIVVMYLSAGIGYLIDWAMTGIVASIVVQKTKKRAKDIGSVQKELIDRWGPEVTGTLPMDEYGFPREAQAGKNAED
jgi:hypothetical protein